MSSGVSSVVNESEEQKDSHNGQYSLNASLMMDDLYKETQSQSLSASPGSLSSGNKHRMNSPPESTLKTSASTSSLNKGADLASSSASNLRTVASNKPVSRVESIISITPTCYLRPKCFFVAWNSVITLVFNGWPEPIDTMKSEMASSCTLCKEMFGSKFPKITLACVKDGVEMTKERLAEVRMLCKQATIPKDYVLCLDALSVVLWENRCQESIIYEKIIPLKKNHKFLGSPRPLLLDLEEDEDDGPYLRSANRSSHYRSLVIGTSLVHRLIVVPNFITEFQAKLPKNIFDTFSRESLHVTLRALS